MDTQWSTLDLMLCGLRGPATGATWTAAATNDRIISPPRHDRADDHAEQRDHGGECRTRHEVAQPLPGGRVLVTESGPKPRLMEMDKSGKVLVEFPLQCQTNDFHMQTRMARKLKNGHYLVPHLIDLAVKEYTSDGKVVWEAKTPNWPFQALREDNGSTLITCTRGNMVIEVDKDGKTIWQLTNDDLPGAPLKDACAAHILTNGHIVVESYGAGGPEEIKLLEVTRDKKIVWALYTGRAHGIHEFKLLDVEGKPLKEKILR